MLKLQVPVNCLQVGDVVGSGEYITWVGRGATTPSGYHEVHLAKQGELKSRLAIWGSYTKIGIKRHSEDN